MTTAAPTSSSLRQDAMAGRGEPRPYKDKGAQAVPVSLYLVRSSSFAYN
jgi:hypothetical protein